MSNDVAIAPVTREELIKMVARAHADAPYAEASLAGKTLAAQSKLPRVIAENLGAGFGQWDFFPEATEIVDFASSYEPPQNEEDIWKLARAWATDDAGSKHTLMALVGREIVMHELRRVSFQLPQLKELVEETRQNRANTMRAALGLAVPPPEKAPAAAPSAPAKERKPRAAASAEPKRPIPTRMPKPEFVPPPKKEAPPPPKKFAHPKFGEGTLEKQDGNGIEAKLTVKFASGTKTLLAKFLTEVP